MAFSQLSETIQNIYIVDFEYKAKLIMLGFLLIASLWYIFYGSKQWETPYITVGFLKMFLYISSVILLLFSPLMSWFLSPNVSIDIVIRFVIVFYLGGLVLFMIVFILNFLYYSPAYILHLAGIKTNIPRDNIILNKIDGYVAKKLKLEIPRGL